MTMSEYGSVYGLSCVLTVVVLPGNKPMECMVGLLRYWRQAWTRSTAMADVRVRYHFSLTVIDAFDA